MSVKRIDEDLCLGCGKCVESCPMDVLRLDEAAAKAVIAYQRDCGLCALCEIDCPQHAILVSPARETAFPTCWGV